MYLFTLRCRTHSHSYKGRQLCVWKVPFSKEAKDGGMEGVGAEGELLLKNLLST